MNINDEVVIKSPHWHEGEDIGGRTGRIISLKGYVLVNLYNYKNNPVKCFRSEVQKTVYNDESDLSLEDDGDLFSWMNNQFDT